MNKALNTDPNIVCPDDFYEALINTHQDLSTHQSQQVNARLVLLLANHVGTMDVLTEALAIARDGISESAGKE